MTFAAQRVLLTLAGLMAVALVLCATRPVLAVEVPTTTVIEPAVEPRPAETPAEAAPEAAPEAGLASPWVDMHKSRSRLSAGKVGMDADGKGGTIYGFVELELQDGWKTYWRSPGDSGIPPRVDFAKSENSVEPVLLYPAPKRIPDKAETIVGYSGKIAFPVVFKIEDATKPVELDAVAQFGICKDICVPIEATLHLTIPETLSTAPSKAAVAALASVPRAGTDARPNDPKLIKATAGVSDGLGRIVLKADFPGGTSGADAFLEAPDGLYLPFLTKTGEDGTTLTFEADLTKDVDLSALAGKDIRVTLVSKTASSETSFPFN